MKTSKPGFVSVRYLEERPVHDSNGRMVGHVDDVVIDADSGRVSHLTLALCPPGGAFDGYVTVPWSVMRVLPDAEMSVEVTVRGETLKKLARKPTDEEPVRH